MKILIIGDWPKYHGGVVNYTRPLALELHKRGHEVFYLYSTANLALSTFGKERIEKDLKNGFPFQTFCLWDGKSLLRNYDNLDIDTNPWLSETFTKFLKKISPDVVHIHEIFGFSSDLIRNCSDLKIPVVNTIHEYWFLCPHRVMVDFNKKICSGPENFAKCAKCVATKAADFNRKRITTKQKLNFYLPKATARILAFRKSQIQSLDAKNSSFDFGSENFSEDNHSVLQEQLKNRLTMNIKMLNKSSRIIAVSNDVKKKLTHYGVKAQNVKVQHIGSRIAEIEIKHTKPLEKEEVTFGFIGGVGYYKGVHLIAQAFLQLSLKQRNMCKFKIFGKGDADYINSIKNLIKDEADLERFVFYGAFTPDDVPEITNQIDISILPSLCADTAPQTIFESYSASLPVIGPNIGGFPDFIEDGVNGLLFEAANVRSLANKLIQIVENPHLIEVFRKNIPSLKNIQTNVDELIKEYESLLH